MKIAIAGPSGSGKTYLGNLIADFIGRKQLQIISQDNYYDSKWSKKKQNYDHPKSFDDQLLLTHLTTQKRLVRKRIYSFIDQKYSSKRFSISKKKIY